MSSSPENASSSGTPRAVYVLTAALVAAGAVAGLLALTAGTTVGGVFFLVAVAAVIGVHQFLRRNEPERTDERARTVSLTAKATAYDAMLGLLTGAMIYQWIAHGRTQAEPMVYVVVAAILVHIIVLTTLRRRA